jgi:BirA family biotin operon repressor/biotin-[acetyl-CoA-carboxylase] ligase
VNRAENHSLDVSILRAGLSGSMWRAVEVVEKTGSTNADVLARARAGEAEGLVLVAEEQTAGRGRMDREWVAPPRAALTFSFLLLPSGLPVPRRGWLPLLAGISVVAAVRGATRAKVTLKWPNDVLADGGKLAGILAEAAGEAVVVGIGVNVSTEAEELQRPGPGGLPATSLRMLGSPMLDREQLLIGILLAFERRYQAWRHPRGNRYLQARGNPHLQARGNPAALRAEYLELCETIGRKVRVERPGGQSVSGDAMDVDSDGRLVLRVSAEEAVHTGGASVAIAAGDVVHLR